jgi:uncharacterized protein YdbL (DUF1318 family)
MKTSLTRKIALAAAAAVILAVPPACTWRTEHKVETVHKIDAHIVLDIRQIKEQASQIEDYVRTDDAATTPGDGIPTSMVTADDLLRMTAQPAAWTRWLPLGRAAAQTPAESPSGAITKEQEQTALKARKERSKAVDQALTARYVGENFQGYLEVLVPKDDEKAKSLRVQMEALARDENRDRRIIYLALAERTEQGRKALPAIESIFAGTVREKLKKGQMFQTPKDPKAFDAYKQTAVGKAHPDAKPNQWVVKAIDPPKENK